MTGRVRFSGGLVAGFDLVLMGRQKYIMLIIRTRIAHEKGPMMRVALEIDEATLSALRDGAVGKVTAVAEPQPEPIGPPQGPLAPIMDALLLRPDAVLHWNRPRRGERHEVRVLANGQLEARAGQRFSSPSGAADGLAGGSNDGWECWRTDDGDTLADLRKRLKQR